MTCSFTKKIFTASVIFASSAALAKGAKAPVASESVLSARWEGKATDARQWTLHSYSEVSKVADQLPKTLPADIKDFCPQYSSLSAGNKTNFWVYLLSSMAQLESNFKPALSYQEAFKDSKGQYVVSRGLLQISIESGNAYGCGFKNASELHDPYKNLSCGLRILNRWVASDKRIAGKSGSSWRGGARYWSVLRTASKVNSIKSWTRGFCNTHFR